jgi:DNA repair exonuclease SbcCD ATPase subunit
MQKTAADDAQEVALTKAELSRLKKLETQAANDLASIDHKIGCPCGECGRPITENELASAKTSAETKLTLAQKQVESVEIYLTGVEKRAIASQSAVSSFMQGMTDLSKEVAQRASYEALRVSLYQTEQQRQRVLQQAKDDIQAIQNLKAEISPYSGQMTKQQALIDDTKTEIANVSSLVEIKRKKLDLETEVVRVFSPAGVRARVLDEITPYLNGQTSKYLAILSDGNITAEWSTLTPTKAGEMKERFAIDVSSTISSKTFKGLSGGEKRKVRVATALALQDLVSTRATKPIDLFIGDEIDHALDASGLERLMVILDEKAKERGTVMVISHNSLKDEIKQVLTVERTATGETKISETAA